MIGDAVVNDGPGLLLIVEKFPWANTVEVTKGVEAAIDEMRPGLPDIDIDTTIFRPATFVETVDRQSHDVAAHRRHSGRAGSAALPLGLAHRLDQRHDHSVDGGDHPTGALLVWDDDQCDGVGGVGDCHRRRGRRCHRRCGKYRAASAPEHRREGSTLPTATIVLEASVEVRNAIVYCLADRNDGAGAGLLHGRPVRRLLPAACSGLCGCHAGLPLVALTVTPALILILLSNVAGQERMSPIIPPLHRGYDGDAHADRQTNRCRPMRSPPCYWLPASSSGPLLGQELLPSFKERDFLMHWLTQTRHIPSGNGADHQPWPAMNCATIPGVRNCGSHIGQALFMDEVYGIYFGENWISVDPAVDYDETLAKIQETVDGYPRTLS